ncbi:MAG: TRAP transporter small permease [Burkholderiaceae bacterium]|nr:TRAP transporter small permease [Burkholderiaceae bacterium]
MNIIGRIAMVTAIVGALVAFVAGVITTVSVLGRALFFQPIPGDVEIMQFAVGLSISLCLPLCQYRGANIMVDFFTQRMAQSAVRRLDALGMLLLAAMYGLLSWRTSIGAISVREAFEATMILDLPMWWSYASLAPGLAFAGVIALMQAVRLAMGRPLHGPENSSAGASA